LYCGELDIRKVVLLVSENMYVDISAAIDIWTRLMGNGEWGKIPMEAIDSISETRCVKQGNESREM
jgi:hypothetical protein